LFAVDWKKLDNGKKCKPLINCAWAVIETEKATGLTWLGITKSYCTNTDNATTNTEQYEILNKLGASFALVDLSEFCACDIILSCCLFFLYLYFIFKGRL